MLLLHFHLLWLGIRIVKSVCWLRSIEQLQKAGDTVEINPQAGCEEILIRIIPGAGTEIMAETYARLHTSFTVHILRP
jgi:hypothetical protein